MRKIEQITTDAFWKSEPIRKDNSRVDVYWGRTGYFLHGYLIAERRNNVLTMYDGGWQTRTTKSRLNAILESGNLPWRIRQKNSVWFAYNLETGEEIPFFNGWAILVN